MRVAGFLVLVGVGLSVSAARAQTVGSPTQAPPVTLRPPPVVSAPLPAPLPPVNGTPAQGATNVSTGEEKVDVPGAPAPSAPPPASAPPNAPPSTSTTPGTPLPGLAAGAFAGDAEADPNTSVILDNADSFLQTEPGKWVGLGNVRVRYKGYTLSADRVDADLDAGETLFSGHVVLHAPNGETVNGGPDGALRLNLRRDTYTVSKARTTISQQALSEASGLGIILPIFVYGGTISSKPGLIDARGSSFTTCDFLAPHYSFRAKQVYIFPGRRLVARNVSLYRREHRVLTLPYFFVPLDRRFARQTLFPQVGQTPDEGVFVKFAFGYALSSVLPGILRVEEMQKKGTGLGFEQNYGDADTPQRGSGLVSLYRLYDQATGLENLNGTLNHTQTFGTVAATLSSSLQQNSYYAGAGKSRSLSNDLSLTRSVGNLNSALRANLSQSDYGVGVSQTLTSSFDQTFRPTSRSQFQSRFDYSQYVSPGFSLGAGTGGTPGSDQRSLDTNLDYSQRGRVYDMELLGVMHTAISGGGSGTFGGVERLPELRLGTDAARLPALATFLPRTTQMTLSLGDFLQPTAALHTQRLRFGLDTGSNTRTLNTRNFLDYGASFQQGFYGDDTAQYVLNGHTGYRLRIGQKSSIGATYTYLRPYGYTPLSFDYAGYTNLSSFNYAYQEARALQLLIATGYDFNRTRGGNGFGAAPWQNVAFQSIFTPTTAFRLRTTASYDLNHNTLLDLTNTIRVRGRGGLALDLAGRFAPQQHKFSNINGNLDLPFFRDPNPAEDAGYRLRAIGGYNGFTRRFDYQGLALTRSWHDYEATLIYQNTPNGLRPGSTLTLNFRLKAFPAYEPFATGQFGQSLDTGIGEVY